MDAKQTMVKMVFDRWYALIERCDSILNAATDEQLLTEIAPGRNRAQYVLGHLIAVHDDMLPILNFGDRLYPELQEAFLKSPENATAEIPSAKELRVIWAKHCEAMTAKFKSLQPEQWFEKHNSVSAEDFVKEPHRNKLNIIFTRTTHLAYHVGQLALIK